MPASPIDSLPRPLAVVAHDAGAANMIAAWVAAAKVPPERVHVAGPAEAIWQRRFGSGSTHALDEALAGAACLLSGTGWASDLEHRARLAAEANGVESFAVIDHWVNYEARFERNGEIRFPDTIIVGDPLARDRAMALFAGLPVVEWPNFYLAEQVAAAGPLPGNGDTLFVAEPARSDWGREQPGEFQALDWFVERGGEAAKSVRLRPHPSDPSAKFDDWLAAHDGWTLDTCADLSTALQHARTIAGLNSMAMVVALEAGREVICAIPPWGPDCALPHAGIRRLGRT